MRANGREGRGLPLGVRASRESPGKVAHRGVHRRCSWALSRRGLAVWLFGRPARRRRAEESHFYLGKGPGVYVSESDVFWTGIKKSKKMEQDPAIAVHPAAADPNWLPPQRRQTTARLVAYCGFGGDEAFAEAAVAGMPERRILPRSPPLTCPGLCLQTARGRARAAAAALRPHLRCRSSLQARISRPSLAAAL